MCCGKKRARQAAKAQALAGAMNMLRINEGQPVDRAPPTAIAGPTVPREAPPAYDDDEKPIKDSSMEKSPINNPVADRDRGFNQDIAVNYVAVDQPFSPNSVHNQQPEFTANARGMNMGIPSPAAAPGIVAHGCQGYGCGRRRCGGGRCGSHAVGCQYEQAYVPWYAMEDRAASKFAKKCAKWHRKRCYDANCWCRVPNSHVAC